MMFKTFYYKHPKSMYRFPIRTQSFGAPQSWKAFCHDRGFDLCSPLFVGEGSQQKAIDWVKERINNELVLKTG